jgi:hypothetical protein
MRQEELKLIISAVDQATAAIQSVGQAIGWLGGAVTKASMQFNAITQAAQTAGQAMKAVFSEVSDAVEGFNMAVIQSAAMITGMMKEDGRPLAERYREAKTYAHQLQLVLEQIDKETLLTARDLSNMTMEMQKQGVLLDVTNQKQLEAFKSLSNAVAVVSQGYPAKEVQIRQEIRSLLSGQTRATDTLSGMLKAQVPDLEEQIALHKEQGNLIEWLGEQLQGFAAASGDIENTWEAVKTSMETIYRQVLRGALSEPFYEVVGLLKQMSDWFVEHKEQIQEGLGRAWAVVKSLVVSMWELFKALAPLLQPVLVIAQALAVAFEDIALRVIPGMVRAIADTFGKVKEFYEWLKSKTTGGEEGGDVLIGAGRSQTSELTEADLQNMQRGLTVAPPATKKPPNEELQKKLDEWKKLRESLQTTLAREEAQSDVDRKLAEIEGKYRQVIGDPKWKGVPGVAAFMEKWKADAQAAVLLRHQMAQEDQAAAQSQKEQEEALKRQLDIYKEVRSDRQFTLELEKEYLKLALERGEITESDVLAGEIAILEDKIAAEQRYIDQVAQLRDERRISAAEETKLSEDARRAVERLRIEVDRLRGVQAMRSEGFLGGFKAEIAGLGDAVSNLVDAGRIAAQGMTQSFRTLFFDVMTANFRSLGDLVKKLFQSLINSIAAGLSDAFSKMLMKGISNAMESMMASMGGSGGGLMGLLFGVGKAILGGFMGGADVGGAAVAGAAVSGGPIFYEPFVPIKLHSGGYVTGAAPAWAVNAWQAATGARRFHLGTDEVPAVLQVGEKVIPRGQSERREQGLTFIQIHAVDSKSFDDMCQRNATSIVRQSTKALQSNQVRSLWNAYLR